MTHIRPSTMRRREALGLLGLGAGVTTLGQAIGIAQGSKIPKSAIIRTVSKDVSPDALRGGTTLMHEHLVGGFYSSPPRQPTPGAPRRREDDQETIDLIVDELKASKRDGLVGIVDASIGRRPQQSIANLELISARSGVHVIVAGGYYLAPYPAGVMDKSEDQIADEYVEDAKTQRWGAFGEIGTSPETHPDEKKMLRAVAKAHLRTGLPIFTHTPHEGCGQCAIEQLDIFLQANVRPQNLCIGHLSDLRDDPKALAPIAIGKRGAWIGFDTVGHELNVSSKTLVTDRMKLRMVLATLEAGLEDQVLLSADMAHNTQLQANWGAGFSAVHVVFANKMRGAGVKEGTIRKILHDNPRRFLAFTPVA